jgi:adenylyltransferase/sulfurtransferase
MSSQNWFLRNNSGLHVDIFVEALIPSNARRILGGYDLILDCTDNAPTRYLLNDTAVALGKPLVSGAALKYDGQLATYNLSPNGPCYRCLFPTPPSPQAMGSCEENGVLGVVTGIIGSLQALEAMKLITTQHGTHSAQPRVTAVVA